MIFSGRSFSLYVQHPSDFESCLGCLVNILDAGALKTSCFIIIDATPFADRNICGILMSIKLSKYDLILYPGDDTRMR